MKKTVLSVVVGVVTLVSLTAPAFAGVQSGAGTTVSPNGMIAMWGD